MRLIFPSNLWKANSQGLDAVSKFMRYFRGQYVNNANIKPIDWLHLADKSHFYYDATNNTAESVNKLIKKHTILPFEVRKGTKKILKILRESLHIFKNLPDHRLYGNSLIHHKNMELRRYIKKLEREQALDTLFPNLQPYRG